MGGGLMAEKHVVTERNAARIQKWFEERGGVAVWPSANLSNPGASWTTPATNPVGGPPEKPTWEAANDPLIITDPAEVVVVIPELVKRFRVAVRFGRQGLSLKVTDAGSARIRREVEKAGDGAWYEFDYDTQEALIFKSGREVPLTEWEAR
jgi:hypothetical protein